MKKLTILLFSLLIICFVATQAFALTEKGYKELRTFAEVLHQVEENYVEPVNEDDLITGAVRGMLMTLDPHTIYMTPDVYKDLKVEATGRFGGVGIEVTLKKGWLVVVAPIEGGPAAAAGVKAGDKIVRVNGVSTKGMDLGEAVTIMRGKVSSRITLTLQRGEEKRPFDVNLIRRTINVPSVTVEPLGDGYIYARISTFQERTAEEMEKKIKKLAGNIDVKGLIIDLRNNPGGLLSEAINVADLFIDKGVIVSTRSRGKEVARYDAKGEGTQLKYPIVLLVNGGSASASEILAGALKDYNKAALVGTQTFGKGSVQSVIELDGGAALKITVAKYYTPSGVSIQGLGITPNLVVEEGTEEGKDPQKDEAVKLLKDTEQYERVLKGTRKHHG